MEFPKGLRYSQEHEWVAVDGDIATIGITDYAQEQLGDVVYVELPAVGKALNKADTLGVIESVKAVSDIYAPVGGTVTEINADLPNAPETVNADPYGKAWVVRLRLSNPQEVNELMDAAAYEKFVAEA
ncbi:MAG: glycine cleavage system protein GcvH [Deltaproteobacteria bacterium]|nr:glycine cleavage system protein GcvH [Deltaproteobacteria bacterium]